MKRLQICISFFISCQSICNAQTTIDLVKNINEIKRDTMYIYAEATMKDLNEAYNGARAILEMKVGDWVKKQHPTEGVEVCIVKAKEHCAQLETRRGEFYRAFVYVRKNDIMPVIDKSEIAVFEVPLNTHAEQSEEFDASIISEDAQIEENAFVLELSPEEKEMKQVRYFNNVEPYIKGLRSRGVLKKYGKYATMPAEDCYMFIYDRAGNITAILRKSGALQYNLNTLKKDDVKNYKNCGAIWFQLKNLQ